MRRIGRLALLALLTFTLAGCAVRQLTPSTPLPPRPVSTAPLAPASPTAGPPTTTRPAPSVTPAPRPSAVTAVAATATSAPATRAATPAASATPARAATSAATPAATGGFPPYQSPTPRPTSTDPVQIGLVATVQAALALTPTPHAASKTGRTSGYDGIAALPLQGRGADREWWLVYPIGSRFGGDTPLEMWLAVYRRTPSGWQRVTRLVLDQGPDFLAEESVSQIQVASPLTWLAISSGAGAHGGLFQVFSFDGQTLREVVHHGQGNPDAGQVRDLNGDGVPDIILNTTEYYVSCYACGVRLWRYEVQRFQGDRLIKVELTKLPTTAPAEARQLNDRAVDLANGELWKDAQAAIAQAMAQAPQDPTVAWNAALIKLYAEPRGQQARQGPARFLSSVLYGDYKAAVDLLRPLEPDQWAAVDGDALIFGTQNLMDEMTTKALAVEPKLAEAYFLRGLEAVTVDRSKPQPPRRSYADGLADLAKAVELNPQEPVFAKGLAYFRARR